MRFGIEMPENVIGDNLEQEDVDLGGAAQLRSRSYPDHYTATGVSVSKAVQYFKGKCSNRKRTESAGM